MPGMTGAAAGSTLFRRTLTCLAATPASIHRAGGHGDLPRPGRFRWIFDFFALLVNKHQVLRSGLLAVYRRDEPGKTRRQVRCSYSQNPGRNRHWAGSGTGLYLFWRARQLSIIGEHGPGQQHHADAWRFHFGLLTGHQGRHHASVTGLVIARNSNPPNVGRVSPEAPGAPSCCVSCVASVVWSFSLAFQRVQPQILLPIAATALCF